MLLKVVIFMTDFYYNKYKKKFFSILFAFYPFCKTLAVDTVLFHFIQITLMIEAHVGIYGSVFRYVKLSIYFIRPGVFLVVVRDHNLVS